MSANLKVKYEYLIPHLDKRKKQLYLKNRGCLSARDHLEYAARHRLVLLTHNPQDFIDLHELWKMHERQHSGILLVYRDNNPSKDMTAADIVEALEKLLASGLPIENTVNTLNHWR